MLAAWLLSLKPGGPPVAVEIAEIDWAPPLQPLPRPPPPPSVQPMPSLDEPVQEPSVPLPIPEPATPPPLEYDWYGDGRVVAGALRGAPERRGFGAGPSESERILKSRPEGPPPLFEQPLPRVGTAVTTPEGETILWVSDYCYISLGSMSLTMKDFHDARKGVRTCIIPIGEREPRGDLFVHLKHPPSGQPSGQPPEQQ